MRQRLALALLLAAATMPAAAHAQDQCRAIRGLTNMDGRRFADVAIGYAGDPMRLSVRVGRTEALPTPKECSLSAEAEEIELDCSWRPGDYAATNALFDDLLARLQRCLADRLTAPTGPRPYGGTYVTLRGSDTTLPVPGGETRIRLRLIEAPGGSSPAYHYIDLDIDFEPGEADGD